MKLADINSKSLKAKLRDLFGKFSIFADSRFNETKELTFYNNLLGFEEERLTESLTKIQVAFTDLYGLFEIPIYRRRCQYLSQL